MRENLVQILMFVYVYIYAYIHCTFMHGHAVVGSDNKLVKYESKLLGNSHTEERLIVKES